MVRQETLVDSESSVRLSASQEGALPMLDLDRLRAQRLSRTPLLQALPLIFKSGFLYKHQILTAAGQCHDWDGIWKEVEEELPVESLVKVVCEKQTVDGRWPSWVTVRGLHTHIPTQAFSRQILDEINNMKVAAATKGSPYPC